MQDDSNKYIINVPDGLSGSMKVLLAAPDTPIVFLIDECHLDEKSTDENISNAKLLVAEKNVTLIGVESHQGGFEWDDYDGRYIEDFNNGEDQKAVSDWAIFADAMRSSNAMVVGIECYGMQRKQFVDCCGMEGQDLVDRETEIDVQDHDLNWQRSKHFIRTLLQLRTRNNLNGNMILNAGGKHNNDIADWITAGTIEEIAGQPVSYVRIRPSSYPK